MQESDNTGQLGIESMRLGGMRITDLPIAEAASVRFQMPIVEDTQRQNQIRSILVGAPKQRVDYLQSRIVEAEQNLGRINGLKSQQVQMISDYTAQISLCEHRDREIARISEDDPNKDALVKDLFKRFPPYQIPAMKQQIVQCKEAIERCDDVVAKEYDTIAEFREVMALCVKRDNDLRNLGAKME